MSYKPGDTDNYGRVVQEDGTVIIPGSRRPDGTRRKDIRVKPDYIPPDEAAKYESKGAKIVRQRKEAGVPGLGPVQASEPKLSKNQKKNIRKKQQREEKSEQQEYVCCDDDSGIRDVLHMKETELADKLAGTHVSHNGPPDWIPGKPSASKAALMAHKEDLPAPANDVATEEADTPATLAKKIKSLAKKVRQTEELKAKVNAGDITPSQEQVEKLERLEAMKQELADLETSIA